MIEHQVYYDANLQMYGGINLRREHLAEMVWVDEAKYFTPYARQLLERRGPPPPESDEPESLPRSAQGKIGPASAAVNAPDPKLGPVGKFDDRAVTAVFEQSHAELNREFIRGDTLYDC